MFSRKRQRSGDLQAPIRASKHEAFVRIDPLVFPFFLAILLAGAAPSRLAAAGGIAGDGTAVSAANLATAPASRFGPASENLPGEESTDAPAFAASHSAVSDPPSSVLESDNEALHPALSTKCVIFSETLCQALKNRRIVVLATLQTAALVSDGVTTRQFLRRGYVEVDPVTRLFIGRKPTWARMAPLGAVQVAAGMWLAERMSMSRHLWIRRFCWLPQMIGIAGNAAATGHNFTLH